MGAMGPGWWNLNLHPQRGIWKMIFLFQGARIVRFHVNLPGCMGVSGVSTKNTVAGGRNPVNSQVEVGSLSHYLHGFGIHPRWLFGISEPSTVAVNCLGWSYNDSALFCACGGFCGFFYRVKSGTGLKIVGQRWSCCTQSKGICHFLGWWENTPHMNPFAIMFFDDWFIFCCAGSSASCHHSVSLFVSMRSIEFNPFGSHLLAVLLLFKSRDTVSHVSCTKEDHPQAEMLAKKYWWKCWKVSMSTPLLLFLASSSPLH